MSSISTPAGQAYDNGLQLSSVGRRLPPAEYLARIQAVTIDDVKNLLDTYFTDVDPIVVAHGPLEEMPDYGILRGWTYCMLLNQFSLFAYLNQGTDVKTVTKFYKNLDSLPSRRSINPKMSACVKIGHLLVMESL